MDGSRAATLLFFLAAGSAGALAQAGACGNSQAVSTLGMPPVPQAPLVYDPNQSVCWLANADLAGDPNMRAALGVAGINPNGSMDYVTAQKWVSALNAYNNGAGYLGHHNWQLPAAPMVDPTCGSVGTGGGSFGPLCSGSALSNLYSVGLNLTFPSSVAPGFGATIGPIHNLKASYYWSQQNNGGTSGNSSGGQEVLSFANGIQGGITTNSNYFYTLPMIPGAIGTPPSCSGGATIVAYTTGPAAGKAVYDCNTGYTWAADANLPASNAFGISGTVSISLNMGRMTVVPKISGGAMLLDTAMQWVQAMNSSGYSGSSAWQIPATSQVLQDLLTDLTLAAGDSRMMSTGTSGPFQNIQPFYYWGCQRDQAGSSQSPCTDYAPSQLQWSFNFDAGFQPTSSLNQNFFVMVYYPITPFAGPIVTLVANAEGESATIAPNTWVEIKGTNLAPPGAIRTWLTGDFINNQMPIQLDGVSVKVNGKSAYLYYISPTQINILTPPDALPASAPIVVSNNGAPNAAFTALAQTFSPSFFVFGDGSHIVAAHSDGTFVGPASFSFPGYVFSPVKPGEQISLYTNGLGATSMPVIPGSISQGGTLSPVPAVTVAGRNAQVDYAGLISPGVFQFNITLPSTLPSGELAIRTNYGGVTSPAGTILTTQR